MKPHGLCSQTPPGGPCAQLWRSAFVPSRGSPRLDGEPGGSHTAAGPRSGEHGSAPSAAAPPQRRPRPNAPSPVPAGAERPARAPRRAGRSGSPCSRSPALRRRPPPPSPHGCAQDTAPPSPPPSLSPRLLFLRRHPAPLPGEGSRGRCGGRPGPSRRQDTRARPEPRGRAGG